MAPIYDAGRPHLLLPRDDGVESAPNTVAITLVCIMAVTILAGFVGLALARHNRSKKAKQLEITQEELRRRREWRDFVRASQWDQQNAHPMRPIARTRGYPPGSADHDAGFTTVDLDGPTAMATTSNSRFGNIYHSGTNTRARRYSVNPYSPYGQGFPYCSGFSCECPPSQPSSPPSRLLIRILPSEHSTGPSTLVSVPAPPPGFAPTPAK